MRLLYFVKRNSGNFFMKTRGAPASDLKPPVPVHPISDIWILPLHDLSSFSSSFPYQKIVLNVAINCQKCKIQVMKAVLKLTGVDVVIVDAEKGTLTVVGSVDPVCVITNVRKTEKYAEIMSVGPPKKPADLPKPKPLEPLPPCCNECQLVACVSCY